MSSVSSEECQETQNIAEVVDLATAPSILKQIITITTSAQNVHVDKEGVEDKAEYLRLYKIGPLAVILHLWTIASPILFIFIATLCTYNMDLLLYCHRSLKANGALSFGQVGGQILGARGHSLIDCFLIAMQLGVCCVYFTFIATNLHIILPPRIREVTSERLMILMIFPFILCLSWLRTLKRITPFSSLANVAVAVGIIIVFYLSLTYRSSEKPHPIRADVLNFAEFYGTAVYSFEGIGLILPLQNEMRHPEDFRKILLLCMIGILILFVFIGQVPVLAFGRIENGSMTAVLQHYIFEKRYLVVAANILLAFACLLSFPIQFYPAIEILESRVESSQLAMNAKSVDDTESARPGLEPTASVTETQQLLTINCTSTANYSDRSDLNFLKRILCAQSPLECKRTIIRSLICLGLMVTALCIPNVGLLISLIGAVCSSMLAVILPPYMYLKLQVKQRTSISYHSLAGHSLIILFGILGMAFGTTQAVLQVVRAF